MGGTLLSSEEWGWGWGSGSVMRKQISYRQDVPRRGLKNVQWFRTRQDREITSHWWGWLPLGRSREGRGREHRGSSPNWA